MALVVVVVLEEEEEGKGCVVSLRTDGYQSESHPAHQHVQIEGGEK